MELKQDMPPPGGYAPITYSRVPLRKGWSPKFKFLLSCVVTGVGWVGFNHTKAKLCNEKIEMRCAKLALTPMLQAEADRMILKQLRRNRDAEEAIMKDVEGWELGKWQHLKVYNTLEPDEFFFPHLSEYFAHSDYYRAHFATHVFKSL